MFVGFSEIKMIDDDDDDDERLPVASPECGGRGAKSRGLGTEFPQRGPGAEPRWGVGAKPPQAGVISIFCP